MAANPCSPARRPSWGPVLAGAAILLAQAAVAAPSDAEFTRLNQSVALAHVTPRYARLAEATAKLDQAGQALCQQ
ncbi:hypothetical protein AB0066_25485, partial [Klebsiella pneumoniae]